MLARYKGAVNRSALAYGTFHSVTDSGLPYTWPMAI